MKKHRGRPKHNILSEEFLNVIAGLDTAELKERVFRLAQNSQETKSAMKNDVKLADARDLAKDLSAPYKETLKLLSEQQKHVLKTLEERGQV